MFNLFSAIGARLKALFVTSVALDFESDSASRNAERKAQLLRQAADYEKDGLPEVAHELRQRAGEIDMRTPLASVLPSLRHWEEHADDTPTLPRPPGKNGAGHNDKNLLTHRTPRKTKHKRR